jgi:hypothetical protein
MRVMVERTVGAILVLPVPVWPTMRTARGWSWSGVKVRGKSAGRISVVRMRRDSDSGRTW